MKINPHLASLVDLSLSEDLGSGDLTTEALFTKNAPGKGRLIARQDLVVSGLEIAEAVFVRLNPSCRFLPSYQEGKLVRKGDVLARVEGSLRCILSGERTALNFLQHLCGIATLTRAYVKILQKTSCLLLDTRKTTPGFRVLEKAAVRHGGGHNHRMGLFDGVIIKDNHISATGSIGSAVVRARKRIPPTVKIEVEAGTLKQVRQALKACVDIIMLDNMSIKKMSEAVKLVNGRARTEASGRINLDNLADIARTGVDFISTGAITHSAPAADIAMEIEST